MKILSLNAVHTKSQNEVAFNVDVVPDTDALTSLDHAEISVSYENGVLVLKPRQAGMTIEPQHIFQAQSCYNNELKRLQKIEEKKVADHAKMVEEVAAYLNIKADTDLEY